MRFKKLMLAAAAVSMTASPVLAAQPVAPTEARASAEAGDSQLGGGWLVALLAAAAVIAAILILVDNDDDPESP